MTLDLILLVIALVLLILAAFGVAHPRINLGWLGLALVVATMLV